MAKIGLSTKLLAFAFLTNVAVISSVRAQEQDLPRRMPVEVRDKIEYYSESNIVNQIPYFDNRFRIDANIEEITLLFYRKSGTPPIILVRPDGSKLKVNNLPKEKVSWYDDRTFDMIKIKQPMPGPWQAIGAIEPDSRIMIVSEVRIEVEPLPEVLLSGETLKITGQLFNGDNAITTPDFRDVVQLDVDFYSTNNSAYDNFGSKPVQLTSFRDDGYDLDEYAGDSIFTGEFELNFAPGEWVPIYYVNLPMAKRELRQKPVIVRHNPISIHVDAKEVDGKPHLATFSISAEYVDPSSLIFQGKVIYPDKQEVPFSIMEGEGEERILPIENTEAGIYRIKVGAYGKTINGREFRLVVPEHAFNVAPAELEILIDTESEELAIPKLTKEEELAIAREIEKEAQAKRDKETYIAIGIANGVILLLFGLGYGVYFWRKKKLSKG